MISKATKPYLVRAIWEWCTDNGYTAYLAVQVDENTRVPFEFVKNGEIILNISADATHKLTLGNDLVQFAARFGGVSRECSVPMSAVRGIFARENGEGMFFQAQLPEPAAAEPAREPTAAATSSPTPPTTAPAAGGSNGRKSHLQVVK
ncbi:MAG: ClpXP protease specificity-enhancing factor [Betaproteobacteria bacterium]|nr:ClpXP protease specificity-enhancing factor [Betaproteobacteria bacterium]